MRRYGLPLLGLLSCEHGVASEEEPKTPPQEIRFELEGCAHRTQHECWLPPASPAVCERGGPLQLWSDTHLEVRIDGTPVASRPGGAGFRWSIAPGEHEVELRHRGRVVGTSKIHDALDEPAAVQLARSNGGTNTDELWSALDTLEPRARLAALDLLTDTLLLALHDPSQNRPALHDALELHSSNAHTLARSLDDPDHAACHARRALFTALNHANNFERAARWAERLRELEAVSPYVLAKNSHYLGLVARRFGELQSALDSFETVDRIYRQLGLTSDVTLREARTQRAVMLADLGQPKRARDMIRDTDDVSTSCVDWLTDRNNRLWTSILLEEQGVEVDDPSPDFEDIIRLMFDLPECYDERLLRNVLLNLAMVQTRRGRLTQAATIFDDAEALGLAELREFAWIERLQLYVQTRLPPPPAPAEQRPALPDTRWRRAYWEGRLAQTMGRRTEAIASYRTAEEVLTELARGLRFDGGRESVFMGRRPSSAHLVDLLLDAGKLDDALCQARRARSRADQLMARTEQIANLSAPQLKRWRAAKTEVSRLEQQVSSLRDDRRLLPLDERAKLDRELEPAQAQLDAATRAALSVLYGQRHNSAASVCEALRAPEPSELALLLYPLDAEQRRWAVFAFDSESTHAARIELEPHLAELTPLVALLEGRFAPLLETAEVLRVLPTAKAWSISYANLPWKGAPLLEHVPIALSLDLAQPASAGTLAHNAVVVGDPNRDLQQARDEAIAVASALKDQGWEVTTLLGPQATVQRVRAAVTAAPLLHFAGHASEAGLHGWESRVQLGREGSLDALDILSLEVPPAIGILPACEVVAKSGESLGGGMSVARSLLLSGTAVVVGGTEKLDDDVARRVSEALYAAGVPTTANEAARSLRDALLTVARQIDDPEVLGSFVALIP